MNTAPATANPLHQALLARGYQLMTEIAHGGMGVVYEALQQSTNQRVAIKILSEDLKEDPQYHQFVERFLNEARAISILRHPGIVQLIDQGQLPGGTVFIVMEYLDGETLYARMARCVPGQGFSIALSEVLDIGRQIAAALSAAHDKAILHRDLKPSNVMLVPNPQDPKQDLVKLVDFGVARFLDTPHQRTTVGSVVGTPAYMSPEQCQGREIDAKSDTYSLGVLLYEMVSGQPPFEGTDMEVMIKHMTADPSPLRSRAPDVPRPVEEFVHELLSKHPRYRPPMAQVADRLSEGLLSLSRRGQTPAMQSPAGIPRVLLFVLPLILCALAAGALALCFR